MTITAGQFLMVVGLLTLCLAPARTPTWLLAVLMFPVGLGGPLAIPPVTALLLDSVPPERAGTVSGVLNTCRQLGGALAVAVFGALVAHHATFLHGLRVSLLIAAVLLLATTAASLLRRPTPQQRPKQINAHRDLSTSRPSTMPGPRYADRERAGTARHLGAPARLMSNYITRITKDTKETRP